MKKKRKEPIFDSQAYWDDFERRYLRGEMKTIPDFARAKKALALAARRKLDERTKLVSIRVRKNDLEKLRARSEREGLPYQTLINSLIHKYAEGDYKR